MLVNLAFSHNLELEIFHCQSFNLAKVIRPLILNRQTMKFLNKFKLFKFKHTHYVQFIKLETHTHPQPNNRIVRCLM